MTAGNFSSITNGWVAIATGIAGLLGLAFIILFFTVGQPFGTLNDICIGVAAILSSVLACILYSGHQTQSTGLNGLAFTTALIGAIIVSIGSVLVIFNFTGWYLAGLYMAAGNALIGLWLLLLSYQAQQSDLLPHGLFIFGYVAAVIMVLGLATIPGIFARIDAWDSAAWYVNYIGQAGALGYLVLYPVWCILAGRYFLIK